VDLAVGQGRVCALLGGNGAGKTTLVRILSTLLRPDAGRVVVAGHDVRRAAGAVRRRVGLVGQYAALDEVLSGRQNLVLFARLRGHATKWASDRADELLASFDLAQAADRAVSTYSGGMRRRLDLAVGLIDRPPVLFVDEPTTGLDPQSRRDVWTRIRTAVAAGTTVLLTTQYLDEADALADDVVILRDGHVIATGTPASLKRAVGDTVVELRLAADADVSAAAAAARDDAVGPVEASPDRRRLRVPVAGAEAVVSLCVGLTRAGVAVTDLDLRRPTLDDVFLRLHGDREPRGETR
jgi:ABC-2 type transport system ATP-binding protein